jgi:hypothetical protein
MKTGEIFESSLITRLTGLLVGLTLINFTIFIQFSAYHDVEGNWQKWNREETGWFMSLDRIAFSLGLSLVFLPILLGRFKVLAVFLGSSIWVPLARLTFSCYLVHLTILTIEVYNY